MSASLPKLPLDVVIVPIASTGSGLAVLRRMGHEGMPSSLISGSVSMKKDVDLSGTARRIFFENTGVEASYVEQLETFSGHKRAWLVTVIYFLLVSPEALKTAVSKTGLEIALIEGCRDMVVEQTDILARAVSRVRSKSAYTDLPARMLSSQFSLTELHRVYEETLGEKLNVDAFRRKVMEREFLQEAGGKRRQPGAHRPSQLYQLKGGFAVFGRRF